MHPREGVTWLLFWHPEPVTNPHVARHARPSRSLGAAATGVALVGGLTYLGLADPHRPGFLFPPCPFKALTGWNCPLCGGLRMGHDLLHADLPAAVVDNAFALVAVPLLAVWILVRRRQGRSILPVPAAILLVLTVVAWTVIRNLPGFPLVPTCFAR